MFKRADPFEGVAEASARLRMVLGGIEAGIPTVELLNRAADEIERLREKKEELQAMIDGEWPSDTAGPLEASPDASYGEIIRLWKRGTRPAP